MKKKSVTSLLHKPVSPILAFAVILVCLVGILSIVIFVSQSNRKSSQQLAITQPIPSPTPSNTPTLAASQKTICLFNIQATSHKTSPKALSLTRADTGRTFTVDMGTLLILFCTVPNFHVSSSSPQNIFAGPSGTIHLPNNAIGAYRVFRAGFGTITVTGTE